MKSCTIETEKIPTRQEIAGSKIRPAERAKRSSLKHACEDKDINGNDICISAVAKVALFCKALITFDRCLWWF